MRFYALLLALRFGVPPYRVATLYLDSGEWQAEDVDARVLERAADRVVEAERFRRRRPGARSRFGPPLLHMVPRARRPASSAPGPATS
jgi:hypothetical protein